MSDSPRESWSEVCLWTCFCCCRCDGVSAKVKCLDLIGRLIFWASGMTTGVPDDFNRRRYDALTSSANVHTSVNDRDVATRDLRVPSFCAKEAAGALATPVAVRHYRRVQQASASECQPGQPVLIYFHGGGMCIQSERQQSSHDLVLELVRRTGCEAYNVGYRLAPEHPFPCALRDAYSVLRFVHSAAQHTGAPIVLAGDSAGGNLSIVLALLVVEGVDADCCPATTDGGTERAASANLSSRIRQLCLLYPSLYEDTPSQRSPRLRYLLPRGARTFFNASYLGVDPDARAALLREWRVSPASRPRRSCLAATTPSSTRIACSYAR
jgi:hypothetical protein